MGYSRISDTATATGNPVRGLYCRQLLANQLAIRELHFSPPDFVYARSAFNDRGEDIFEGDSAFPYSFQVRIRPWMIGPNGVRVEVSVIWLWSIKPAAASGEVSVADAFFYRTKDNSRSTAFNMTRSRDDISGALYQMDQHQVVHTIDLPDVAAGDLETFIFQIHYVGAFGMQPWAEWGFQWATPTWFIETELPQELVPTGGANRVYSI